MTVNDVQHVQLLGVTHRVKSRSGLQVEPAIPSISAPKRNESDAKKQC
jgi:hypothetical protein